MTVMSRDIALTLAENDYNTKCLRTNKSLLKDEWIRFDTTIMKTLRIRLNAAQDLMTRGLVDTMDGLAFSLLQWTKESRTEEVNVSMDPQVGGRSEALDFTNVSIPLPIFHAEYFIGDRQLRTSRRGGAPLDTSMARNKTKDIAEKVEKTVVTGLNSYKFGTGTDAGTIYGYTDFPDRGTYTIPAAWDLAGTSGKEIVTDVIAMKQLAVAMKHYGPFVLYIPQNFEGKMDEDYADAKNTNTIRDRILAIQSIEEVKVLDVLPDDNVVLVQMTEDSVQLVNGLPLSNTEWESRGGFTHNFMIWTIMLPRLFSDYDGNSGIIHASV